MLAPGPEAPGPLRADGGPCRFPVREPAPVQHPPSGPCQAQQHDPQRGRGNDRRGGFAGRHRCVAGRGPVGQPAASTHNGTVRPAAKPTLTGIAPARPRPSGAVHRAWTRKMPGILSSTEGIREACRKTAGTRYLGRGPLRAGPVLPTQPAASADSHGAPITKIATSRAARPAAVLPVRRRSGLPSGPSLRAGRGLSCRAPPCRMVVAAAKR